ncbi:hypothetical protein [Noviherbaspirillum denitrificans]|uniref:Uncharacterized protein n=1 Tax=Noviherbaspirillum denitrificans TaxID=1968433 RepID=A0A254T6E1_9BURK|nr:hypothetical protein [Noviherbaspirillum denitrificans]OWW18234.1 hypothetical protein AYR66_02415 [Noviherbaspirillum denitrificans]
MTLERVSEMFRQHAGTIALEESGTMIAIVIEELARLLADSHGRLPDETFESLVRIGGMLYREGSSQHRAKADVDAIMKKSSRE